MSAENRPKFAELDVERINVVDQNGTVRMVLSNKERLPHAVIDGKELTHERPYSGLIFFNDQGDECGGLVFGSNETNGKQTAGASLTFDQRKQDQVVQIIYAEENGRRSHGVRIYDRPERSLADVMTELEQCEEGPAKQQKIREMAGRGEFGVQRMFMGRNRNGEAIMTMADSKGRERIRMRVDAEDIPRLEFLDEEGHVVYSLPPA